MGLVQKGRSRTWLDDHGWWVAMVYFAPSPWAMGASLGINATMLWVGQDWLPLSYSRENFEGVRESQPHVEYTSDKQFEPEARRLVELAAGEIERVRADYKSLADWLPVLEMNARNTGSWQLLDAAIAAGLLGIKKTATHWLAEWISDLENERDVQWVHDALTHARSLSTVISDTALLRRTILSEVETARRHHRLPTLSAEQLATIDAPASRPPTPYHVFYYPPRL
jgi:hypothetical protein